MKTNVLNQLSLRTTDYVALVGQNEDTVKVVQDVASGVVCSQGKKYEGIKFVPDLRELDESAFDKVLVDWNSVKKAERILSSVLKSCEHLGLVIVQNVSSRLKKNCVSYIESKGIYDWWLLTSNNNKTFDLLFKVRKYPKLT